MTPPRFTTLTARAVVLLANDIDTDQIVPARFLKVTDKAGLGPALFTDFKQAYGAAFPLAQPAAVGAEILVVGRNFGCGSSREHAPWALVAGGFRVVVARSFADIFQQNALKNGLLPVALDDGAHAAVVAALGAVPATAMTVDLVTQELTYADGNRATFAVDPFARQCLLDGVDELGYLLDRLPAIEAHEQAREAAR